MVNFLRTRIGCGGRERRTPTTYTVVGSVSGDRKLPFTVGRGSEGDIE